MERQSTTRDEDQPRTDAPGRAPGKRTLTAQLARRSRRRDDDDEPRRAHGSDRKDRPGGKGKGKGAGQPARVVLGEITNVVEEEVGSTVTINIGLEDGATGDTAFRLLEANGTPRAEGDLKILRIHTRTTEVRTRKRRVHLEGLQIEARLPAVADDDAHHDDTRHGDGSIGDAADDRLEA